MIYRIAIPMLLLAAAARAQSPAPPDAEIRRILAERVDQRHNAVGMVVAVIEPSGTRIVAYGKLAKDDARPLNGDTVFEIGSITKVFTALLLEDMAQRGEVKLDDPIAKYLPEGVKAPQRNGKEITLAELATHTSGLPRMPNNFSPKDAANPYADYSADKLYAFLNSYQLPRDPGEKWEYSNLATGLLGHLLSLVAGKDYETLVVSRIAPPLGMASTRITLTPEMKERMAAGYNASLEPARLWDFLALAGAGALRSTANDLITFLAANRCARPRHRAHPASKRPGPAGGEGGIVRMPLVYFPPPSDQGGTTPFMRAYATSWPICSLAWTMIRKYMPSTVASRPLILTVR